MNKRIIAPAVMLLAGATLTGCATAPTSSEHPSPAHATTPKTHGVPKADTAESDDTAAEPTGLIPVTAETITDDVLGHTITATDIVRGFPWTSEQTAFSDRPGAEQILVKVHVTAGDRFFSTMDCSSLRMVAEGVPSDTYPTSSNVALPSLAEAMTAAGYPPLAAVDQGEWETGWCSFAMTDPSPVLDLEYLRLAYGTNFGENIEERTWTVALTPIKS